MFVAYPLAMSRMPLPWLWALLFFAMLALLGFSTMFGIVEMIVSAAVDFWPSLKHKRVHVTVAICSFGFLAGLLLCTRVREILSYR